MNIKKILAGGAASAMFSVSMLGVASAAHFNVNGSFEDGTNPGSFTTLEAQNSSSIENWTVSKGSVDYIGDYWKAADESRSLDLSGNEAGEVTQNLNTRIGQDYNLIFSMAGNPDNGPSDKVLSATAGGETKTFTFNTTGKNRDTMGWTNKTVSFVATSTSTKLTFTSLTDGPWGPALDNVRVVAVLKTKEQCKKDGYKIFLNHAFKNQGDCVSFVQANDNAAGNRKDNTN